MYSSRRRRKPNPITQDNVFVNEYKLKQTQDRNEDFKSYEEMLQLEESEKWNGIQEESE